MQINEMVQRIHDKMLEACQWPEGIFKAFEPDPDDEHGKVFIVMPGGQMIEITGHADPEIDPARAKWICNILNQALSK